jgi:hypothetical protein
VRRSRLLRRRRAERIGASYDGYNALRDQEIMIVPGQEDAARLGVLSCPEHAITILDDSG